MLFDARDRVGDDEVNYRCPSETVVFDSCESSKLRTHIHICELAIMTEGHGAHRNRSTLTRLDMALKAHISTVSTPLGRFTDVRAVNRNASFPIRFNVEGKETFIIFTS